MEPEVSTAISVLIGRGDFDSVASHCEEVQLQAAVRGASHPLFAPHLLSLLILDHLPAARFLITQRKATPPQPSATDAAAIALGEALWKRQTGAFYDTIRSFAWDAAMQPLAMALESAARERAFALLAHAYSCVHVDVVARQLAVTDNVARIECIRRGWTSADGSSPQFLRPPRASGRSTHVPEDPARKVADLTEQLVRMQTTA